MRWNIREHLKAAGQGIQSQMVLVQNCWSVGLKVIRKLAGGGNQVRYQDMVQGVSPGRIGVVMRQPKPGQKRKREDKEKRTRVFSELELFAPVFPEHPDS